MNRKITPHKCLELWQLYATFRRPQIAPSTYQRDYIKFQRRLERLKKQAPHLSSSIEIRDWLLANYSAETSRRTIVQLKACCQWAMESSLLKDNPFQGLQRHIQPAKPTENAYASFTAEERDHVILAFDLLNPYYSDWVRFLFWTGCRPEEARALRWADHIAPDYREILFTEAWPCDCSAPQKTKNYQTTRFPVNDRLRHLLTSMARTSDYVFPGQSGGPFDYHNFQTRYWKPLVHQLKDEGQIAFYLTQYHCRHTWITLALEHLTPQDVSYLARVSVPVLYKHYVGRGRRIIIPEF
ncbi:site-specific integrase [Pseudanabaena sp. FACHB-2040]|uniref:site-specific integrase n=1 Tax=Pseudanabaena sp. FACHB-2040 TaxID=2692859 RepID=UPI00168841F4|nr:site-specific integrase [Pseudanabaena sp. FACHB-2040]MBD2259894.1 site-specific integrase [Pseudanabaena sp. FACHB-2040]